MGIFFVLTMLDKTRLEHFRNLISLSAADGEIRDIERTTLTKIANEHGIPMDRFGVMLNHAHEYAYVIPQNKLEKERQLEEMVELAMVDGDFAQEEYELIKMVAEKLEVPLGQVDQIIESKFGNTVNLNNKTAQR